MAKAFDIPHRKTQLSHDFFARPAVDVAQDLLGRVFVVGREGSATLYAQLHEVAAYQGDAKTASEGIKYAPGIVSVSTKYGKHLVDIATGKFGKPSCVTLIAAEIRDGAGSRGFAQGPGNLSRLLEIDSHYNGLPLNSGHQSPLWMGGKGIDSEKILKRDLSGVSENCKGYFYIRPETA